MPNQGDPAITVQCVRDLAGHFGLDRSRLDDTDDGAAVGGGPLADLTSCTIAVRACVEGALREEV